MGVMDIIRKYSENKKMKTEKFKEMQEDAQLQKMLLERQKSSNERELENYYKKVRENQIKKELDVIRKQQTREAWSGDNFLKGKYMFKSDRSILKDKNIFVDDKNKVPLTNKKGMFFK